MKKPLLAITACALLIGSADAAAAKKKKTSGKRHKTTYYGRDASAPQTDASRPSPYKGDNVPENDGVKKNNQRNLNTNTGQPLPSSSGK